MAVRVTMTILMTLMKQEVIADLTLIPVLALGQGILKEAVIITTVGQEAAAEIEAGTGIAITAIIINMATPTAATVVGPNREVLTGAIAEETGAEAAVSMDTTMAATATVRAPAT